MSKEIYLVMIAEHAGEKIPPFPLLYVGSALKKAGYRVCLRHIMPEQIPVTSAEIIARRPLWVGFSVLTGLPTLRSATMSCAIKRASSIPVVWGGVHPSLVPEQCIAEKYIDYLVVGEGEQAAVELSEALEHKRALDEVAGILYTRTDGGVVRTTKRATFVNLQDYPLDFSLCDVTRYISTEEVMIEGRRRQVRSLGYCASRGCPHACGFCYNVEFNLRRWRGPVSDFVINDINRLKQEYGISKVHVWDDNFFAHPQRALQILDAIDLAVGADVRIDYLNEETVRGLGRNNVVFLLIGIESGSDRILDAIHKGFTVDAITRGAGLLDAYGIPALYSAILGFPSETRSEFNATVDLLLEIRRIHKQASFTIGMYLPYPGTDLYQQALAHGFQPPERTEGWHVVDRWNNRVPLPWSDPDVCRNVRHLFYLLVNAPFWMKYWVRCRLRRKWLGFGLDLKVYLVTRTVFLRGMSRLAQALRGCREMFSARRMLVNAFITRHALRGRSALKHRVFGLPDVGMFSRLSGFVRAMRKEGIDQRLSQKTDARILDAGCGDGTYSLYLAQRFPHARVDGWDISEDAIPENREIAAQLNLGNLRFARQDLMTISATETYDLIVCIAVLVYRSHEENKVMLRNLQQALCAGGVAYLFLTHKGWESSVIIPERFYRRMYDIYLKQNCGRMYDLSEFRDLLDQGGFRILSQRIVYGFWGELAWEIDKVCKEHSWERWKIIILPVLKLMSLLDIKLRNTKGAGMVFIVEKP